MTGLGRRRPIGAGGRGVSALPCRRPNRGTAAIDLKSQERASSGLVGAELRQGCFPRPGSFGHGCKKLRLSHWLALARRVNLPSPGFGWTPFVLDGEGVIGGVESWGLFHSRTIEVPVGRRQIWNRHGATLIRTLPRAAVLSQNPSIAEFHVNPGSRHRRLSPGQSHRQHRHRYDSH